MWDQTETSQFLHAFSLLENTTELRENKNVDHNFLISKWNYLYHMAGNQV